MRCLLRDNASAANATAADAFHLAPGNVVLGGSFEGNYLVPRVTERHALHNRHCPIFSPGMSVKIPVRVSEGAGRDCQLGRGTVVVY